MSIQLYTDGSVLEGGSTGAGVFDAHTNKSYYYNLGSTNIFVDELTTATMALHFVDVPIVPKNVVILEQLTSAAGPSRGQLSLTFRREPHVKRCPLHHHFITGRLGQSCPVLHGSSTYNPLINIAKVNIIIMITPGILQHYLAPSRSVYIGCEVAFFLCETRKSRLAGCLLLLHTSVLTVNLTHRQ